jgi:hypothetical protein
MVRLGLLSGNQEQDIGRLIMMFGLGLSVGLGVTDSTVEVVCV